MSDREPVMPDKPDRPAEHAPDTLWPMLLVLAVVLGGVVYGFLGHWRRASMLVAAAMGLAGLLRLILPREIAGLLVVRRCTFDVVVYLGMAAAITVVAFVVPPAR